MNLTTLPTPLFSDLGEGAWFSFTKGWLDKADCTRLFDQLNRETPWEQRAVILAGKRVQQPRLVAWMSDPPGLNYRYSNTDNVSTPFTDPVREIRRRLWDTDSGLRALNACFLNLYRDRRDSIGHHSDDEPCFGVDPVIASVSFGSTRRFKIQHKATKVMRELRLDAGDLLVMGGTMQRLYTHAIPKEGRDVGPRINLTFRTFLTT